VPSGERLDLLQQHEVVLLVLNGKARVALDMDVADHSKAAALV